MNKLMGIVTAGAIVVTGTVHLDRGLRLRRRAQVLASAVMDGLLLVHQVMQRVHDDVSVDVSERLLDRPRRTGKAVAQPGGRRARNRVLDRSDRIF
jgi:hypothetical protein